MDLRLNWCRQRIWLWGNYKKGQQNSTSILNLSCCEFVPLSQRNFLGCFCWVQHPWGSPQAHFSIKTASLLVPRIKNHLSSFKRGFLNILSLQNVLLSLSVVLFLLQRYKYGTKKCPRNHFRFDFWNDSTLANQKTEKKTIEKPLKELRIP